MKRVYNQVIPIFTVFLLTCIIPFFIGLIVLLNYLNNGLFYYQFMQWFDVWEIEVFLLWLIIWVSIVIPCYLRWKLYTRMLAYTCNNTASVEDKLFLIVDIESSMEEKYIYNDICYKIVVIIWFVFIFVRVFLIGCNIVLNFWGSIVNWVCNKSLILQYCSIGTVGLLVGLIIFLFILWVVFKVCWYFYVFQTWDIEVADYYFKQRVISNGVFTTILLGGMATGLMYVGYELMHQYDNFLSNRGWFRKPEGSDVKGLTAGEALHKFGYEGLARMGYNLENFEWSFYSEPSSKVQARKDTFQACRNLVEVGSRLDMIRVDSGRPLTPEEYGFIKEWDLKYISTHHFYNKGRVLLTAEEVINLVGGKKVSWNERAFKNDLIYDRLGLFRKGYGNINEFITVDEYKKIKNGDMSFLQHWTFFKQSRNRLITTRVSGQDIIDFVEQPGGSVKILKPTRFWQIGFKSTPAELLITDLEGTQREWRRCFRDRYVLKYYFQNPAFRVFNRHNEYFPNIYNRGYNNPECWTSKDPRVDIRGTVIGACGQEYRIILGNSCGPNGGSTFQRTRFNVIIFDILWGTKV